METKKKSTLSFGLRYGYGLGEFGLNFLLTYITYYLTFYLTNVAGLSMTLAATVTTATTVIKVFGMPIAGTLIDSIKLKGSKFRGWMVLGGVLYFVGGTLLFYRFDMEPGPYAIVFCFFFFIYWLGYSASWSSWRALMDPICSHPIDKVGLTAAASQEGTIARVIFSFIATAILAAFTLDGMIDPMGYTTVNGVFGIIALLCFVLVSMITKKYDNMPAAVETKTQAKAAAQKMRGKDFINTIKTRPMLIFILCAVFRCAVLTVMGTLLAFYLQYVLGNADLAQIYILLVYAISFFGALLVQPLAKKIGKRSTFVYTTALSAICVFGLLFTGTNAVAFIVLMCVFQFLGIFSSTLIPVCMADIGEYNSITNGAQARGLVFSIGGMAIQLSSVVGAALASYGMVLVGFDTAAVTEAGIAGLKGLYIWGIGGLSLVSAVLFMLYPLTEKYMEELRAQNPASPAA